MDQEQIKLVFEEGMNLLAVGVFISVPFYLLSMGFLSALHDYPKSQRIKSREKLEEVVKEEADKLGIDNKKIKINFISEYGHFMTRAYTMKNGDVYQLYFSEKLMTRKIVRHELYHVYNDDCDTSNFIHYLISEPRAYLYGAFEIKI